MKLNNIALATVLSLGLVSMANADQGSSTVKFKGKIIDAPCSIASKSLDQLVTFDDVANTKLVGGGVSSPETFDIVLEGCDITAKNKVQVTFSGPNGGPTGNTNTMLAITGEAKGASITMFDGSNQPIVLGTPTTFQNLQTGQNTLSFTAFLQGHPGVALVDIKEGAFTSTTNFTMNYN